MKWLVFLLIALTLEAPGAAESKRQDAINRMNKAGRVLYQTMRAPDQRIPDHILKSARCIAVVPHLIKGGFVFGGEEGKGVATCRTARGWSAPTFIEMGGGSWGTQVGVEAVDLVMVIRGHEGLQRLLSSKFEIGRDASVAVGPVGRHSSENTDAKLNALILTYSRARGAFLGMTFDGAVVRVDNESEHAFYGPRVTSRATLLGEVRTPATALPFLHAVRGAQAQAVAHSGSHHRRKRSHHRKH